MTAHAAIPNTAAPPQQVSAMALDLGVKFGYRRLRAEVLSSEELGKLGDFLRNALHAEDEFPGLREVFSGGIVSEHLFYAGLPAQPTSWLLNTGLLDQQHGVVSSPFRAHLLEGFVVISDPDVPEEIQDPLYLDPLWEAPWLARCILRDKVSSSLDLGCGCGVLSLVLSSFSNKVVAVDLNERALEFTRFNAAINRVQNITCLASDLFQNIPPEKFDRIVFNSPTGEEEQEYLDLLEAGEGILEKFFVALDDRLSEAGYCQLNLAMNDYAGSRFKDRLMKWLAPACGQMQWITLISESKQHSPTHSWRRGWMTMRRGPHFIDQIDWPYPSLWPDVPSGKVTELILRIFENSAALAQQRIGENTPLAWHPDLTWQDASLCLWGIPVLQVPSGAERISFDEKNKTVQLPLSPWLTECLKHGLISLQANRKER